MKQMKTLAKVFTIIALISLGLGVVTALVTTVSTVGATFETEEERLFSIISIAVVLGFTIIFSIVGLIVGLNVLKSLKTNTKKIGLGVASIIFNNALAGIFYLIWDPNK